MLNKLQMKVTVRNLIAALMLAATLTGCGSLMMNDAVIERMIDADIQQNKNRR